MKHFDFLKKIFLFSFFGFTAISASAQLNYILAAGDAISSATPITSVDGITLNYSPEGTFTAASKKANDADADFVAYTPGNSISGAFIIGSGIAPTGCYYKFDVAKNGLLEVGICLNASKSLYVIKASDFSVLPISDLTVNLPDQTDKKPQILSDTYQVPIKSYGTVSFNVGSGESYYVLCIASKLGFYGFKFTQVLPTGITPATVKEDSHAPIYNLSGQRVANAAKGVYIQNGKKFIGK